MFRLKILPIIILSIFVFFSSFFLGFGGDDYYGLLDYLRTLEDHKFVNPEFFFWQYGPQDTLFGLIYKVFGLNPTPFFMISFILRMLAVISFYPLFKIFTKDRTAISLSLLFFAITFAGIETTGWGFNMMAYIAIALLNLFFYFFIVSRQTEKLFSFLFSLILFFLAIILSPTRMTGLFIWVPLMEIVLFVTGGVNMKSFFVSVLRFCAFIGIFLFILTIGNSLSNGTNFKERFANLFLISATADTSQSISKHWIEGNYKVFLHPVQQIGSIVFPISNIHIYESLFTNLPSLITKGFMIFIVILGLLLYSSFKKWKPWYILGFSIGFVFTVTLGIIGQRGREVFPLGISVIWFMIGGYILITYIIYISILTFQKDKKSILGFLSLFWLLSSIFIFWNRFPESVHITSHRYLIIPVVGITCFFALLMSLVKKLNWLMTILGLLLIFFHGRETILYFKNLRSARNKIINTNVRNSLPKITELSSQSNIDHPLVFYFTSNNKAILYHNILFGFPTMAAINEGLMYFPRVVYTDDWREITSAYSTGESLKRFSWPIEPVPIQNIFSYNLDTDRLIDTTNETRQKLLQK